ncbi:hypothetical protein Skr01_34130 [Sphaerisporangium krabiense]|nr:hypothetical protein Skr01_34130 [Sphaerisporangium krabiense]
MGHVPVLADGADAFRGLPVVPRGAQEVRMSVADITPGHATGAQRLEGRSLREAVINDPSL